MKKLEKGTSLLEVLATIAIIVVLASLLLSGIFCVREKQKMAGCISNLKNLTFSLLMYANDNNQFPTTIAKNTLIPKNEFKDGSTAWAGVSVYYDQVLMVAKCPKVQGSMLDNPPVYSYGINQLIRGINLHMVQKPSELIVTADGMNKAVIGKVDEVAYRHMNHALAGFADGHVDLVKFSDLNNADRDYFGATTAQGASGNGVYYGPLPEDEELVTEEFEFSFTSTTACSNGFVWNFGGVTDNGDGSSTFNFTITNNNSRAISNAAFGLPPNTSALWPPNGGTYVGSRNSYTVENTTENPFHSIKFNTIGEGAKNGQSDTFRFTVSNDVLGQVIVMRVQSKGGKIIGNGEFEEGEPEGGDGGCS